MKKSKMPEMVRENIEGVHRVNIHLYGNHCKDCVEAGKAEAKKIRTKTLDEVKSKRHCITGYPHKCERNPDDCEFIVDWDEIEELSNLRGEKK